MLMTTQPHSQVYRDTILTKSQRVKPKTTADLRCGEALQQIVLQLLQRDGVAGQLRAQAGRLLLQVRPLVGYHLHSEVLRIRYCVSGYIIVEAKAQDTKQGALVWM